MALASRLLSKSKQLYSGRILLQQENVVLVRFFAKESDPPGLRGDEMLKNIFLEVKNKFATAIGVLKEEKITIDPDDPAAVEHYEAVMKTVREKAKLSPMTIVTLRRQRATYLIWMKQLLAVLGMKIRLLFSYGVITKLQFILHQNIARADLFSESQRIQYTIQTRTQDILDARTYLLTLKEIRIRRGLTDEFGVEAMMMEALEEVEKEIKKPLMRNDKKGMALLMAEFDKINKKLGIRREDLPKYEEQLEHKIAKAQLEVLKKEAIEAMETQKKREEFKDEEIVDVRSLDIRNFL